MGKKLSGFRPDIAVPPGETLHEILTSLGMSQIELSKRIGLTPKTITGIISGKAPITAETALKLESILGTPASFWNNLEANYQETKARLTEEQEIKREFTILKHIPYNAIADLGYVQRVSDASGKVEELRAFYSVASLNYIPETQPCAFRIEGKSNASPYALAAWLRIGEIKAKEIKVQNFDAGKLKSIIPNIRKLTLEPTNTAQKRLTDLCASCGIALAVVPHLPNTYIYGSARWLTPFKAIIQLSIRRAYADIFWFSFFHELGHILLHEKKKTFIEPINGSAGQAAVLEKQADTFAAKSLIPPAKYREFKNRGDITREEIVRFAKTIPVHPCVVVGRLQHEGVIKHSEYNDLRPRMKWN